MSTKKKFWQDLRNPKLTKKLLEHFNIKNENFNVNEKLEETYTEAEDVSERKDPPWARWEKDKYSIEKGSPANPIELGKKDKKLQMREAIANIIREKLSFIKEARLTKEQVVSEVCKKLKK